MDYEKHTGLINDLAEVAKKHSVSIIFTNVESLSEFTKELDGLILFITNGEPSQKKVIREHKNDYHPTSIIPNKNHYNNDGD
jgi:Lhr-like helicase